MFSTMYRGCGLSAVNNLKTGHTRNPLCTITTFSVLYFFCGHRNSIIESKKMFRVFQKSVPDLTFNSHIFASDPSASRVMINGHYLKPGDGFGPLLVERITEDGVVLSKNGQYFRVGTVRDWVSPR